MKKLSLILLAILIAFTFVMCGPDPFEVNITGPTTINVGETFDITVSLTTAEGDYNVAAETDITLSTDTGTLSGTTTATIAVDSNSVTFTGLSLDTAGDVTLTATVEGVSGTHSITVSEETMVFDAIELTAPATAEVGVPFDVDVQLLSGGNPVNAAADYAITITSTSTIDGTTTGTVSSGSNTGTVSGIYFSEEGTGLVLTATVEGISDDSDAIDVTTQTLGSVEITVPPIVNDTEEFNIMVNVLDDGGDPFYGGVDNVVVTVKSSDNSTAALDSAIDEPIAIGSDEITIPAILNGEDTNVILTVDADGQTADSSAMTVQAAGSAILTTINMTIYEAGTTTEITEIETSTNFDVLVEFFDQNSDPYSVSGTTASMEVVETGFTLGGTTDLIMSGNTSASFDNLTLSNDTGTATLRVTVFTTTEEATIDVTPKKYMLEIKQQDFQDISSSPAIYLDPEPATIEVTDVATSEVLSTNGDGYYELIDGQEILVNITSITGNYHVKSFNFTDFAPTGNENEYSFTMGSMDLTGILAAKLWLFIANDGTTGFTEDFADSGSTNSFDDLASGNIFYHFGDASIAGAEGNTAPSLKLDTSSDGYSQVHLYLDTTGSGETALGFEYNAQLDAPDDFVIIVNENNMYPTGTAGDWTTNGEFTMPLVDGINEIIFYLEDGASPYSIVFIDNITYSTGTPLIDVTYDGTTVPSDGSALDMGSIYADTEYSITIKNVGSADLTIADTSSLALNDFTGSFASSLPVTLAPFETEVITIQTANTGAVTSGTISIDHDDASGVDDPWEFTLTATASTAPIFIENFENGGEIPTGWTETVVTPPSSGDLSWGFISGGDMGNPASSYEGNYNAALINQDGQVRLESPAIDFNSETGTINMSFWLANVDYYGNTDTVDIEYKIGASGTWTSIQNETTAHADWTEITLELPSAAGESEYYIGFNATVNYGYGLCIDYITVTN